VAKRLKQARNVGKRCPDGRNVGKRWPDSQNGGKPVTRRRKRVNVPRLPRFTPLRWQTEKRRENVAKRVKNVVEWPKRRKNGNTTHEKGRTCPGCPVHGRHCGNRGETSGNRAKRVETCEKRGRTVETEENGNTTDDKRRKTDVHAPTDGSRSSRWGPGRNIGKTWPNGWNQVKNVVERP